MLLCCLLLSFPLASTMSINVQKRDNEDFAASDLEKDPTKNWEYSSSSKRSPLAEMYRRQNKERAKELIEHQHMRKPKGRGWQGHLNQAMGSMKAFM